MLWLLRLKLRTNLKRWLSNGILQEEALCHWILRWKDIAFETPLIA